MKNDIDKIKKEQFKKEFKISASSLLTLKGKK
jgi:hypothetical protein